MPFVNNFVVGCDPEFAVVGKDGIIIRPDLPATGQVGLDGGGDLLEFRPAPSKSTWTVLKRLKWLMQHTRLRKYADAKWRGGAWLEGQQKLSDSYLRDVTFSIGGHIHLDVEPDPACYGNDDNREDESSPDLRTVALDSLTQTLEILQILPKETAVRRDNGSYGKYSAQRANDAGGREHMEYRTMPSWLYHPVAAYLCLTGAKLAVVAPERTIEGLNPARASLARLKDWYGSFAGKDTDAQRAVEMCLADKSAKDLTFDPDVDFKETWRAVPSVTRRDNEPQIVEQQQVATEPAQSYYLSNTVQSHLYNILLGSTQTLSSNVNSAP